MRQIQLSDAEDQLCSLLVEFTHTLPQAIECYIAGGWVRDKLLGLSSNDIDIALSSMMGFPFAEQFSSFLQKKNIPCTRVTKVESRPDQSKHLETAKLGVLGLDLDFVNFRSEEYTSGSRIPVRVGFGTKLADTSRRDLTINALLYNVHTRSVEDPTSEGIHDLDNATIRTPCLPQDTFLDDPLRVLRCIRFASRLSFVLVQELVKAARDKEVQTGLAAVVILHSFLFPQTSHLQWETETVAPHPILLQHTLSSTSIQSRLFLACALTPFKDSYYYDKKGKQKPLVEACLRDGLKLGVQDHFLDGIPVLFEGAKLVSEFKLEEINDNPSEKGAAMGVKLVSESKSEKRDKERVAMGLFFRQQSIHSPILDAHWTSTILFSLVQELVPLWRPNNDPDLLNPSNVGFIENEPHAVEIIESYNALIKKAEEFDLIKAVDMPHLLNGHDLTILLGRRPGLWVKDELSKVMEWQLKSPGGNKAECENYIKKTSGAKHVM